MAEETFLLEDKSNGNEYSPENSDVSGSRTAVKKALVIFFGVTIIAAAIIVCTIVLSVYSGKIILTCYTLVIEA